MTPSINVPLLPAAIGEHNPGTMKKLTIVIKLGTSSIVDETTHEPLLSILSLIVETAVRLKKDGHKVVIVSSGAIGTGLREMGMEKRPKQLAMKQALAAIGQCQLIGLWKQLFGHMNQQVGQILITRNDLDERTRYLNAQQTLFQLLEWDAIPIVNENDTLAVTEMKFGDNDTLSAITAGLVHADYLFLMTDVDCLYDKNPRSNPDAKPIFVVEDCQTLTADVSSAGSALGTGGMGTKIVAAQLATSVGVTTIITKSSKPGNVREIVQYWEALKAAQQGSAHNTPPTSGTNTPSHPVSLANSSVLTPGVSTPGSETPPLAPPPLHTRFVPDPHPIRDRYFWILHGLAPSGIVYIDEGAHKALANKAGLLPPGVVDVEGSFAQNQSVRLVVVKRIKVAGEGEPAYASDPAPVEVGRAVVNYSSVEIKLIRGHKASDIRGTLGYADTEYVAQRENVAMFKVERSRPVTPAPEAAAHTGTATTAAAPAAATTEA